MISIEVSNIYVAAKYSYDFFSIFRMILRPCNSLLDDSIFKNAQFPTPNFAITPGSNFTLFKDLGISPYTEDVVYGAANRPTDYSSSSSYYKPDESDGIDKQIQASVRSARTNSGVYSADEMDESSKIDETTQNTSQASSSSSSSSSSDSDSDSDSDSSSSSDSNTSQISQKAIDLPNEPEENVQNTRTDQPSDVIDEDTTLMIKSHLVNTTEINIAQNILLSQPEPPIFNKEAEQIKLLDEKRRRIQESLRQAEMKNHEKAKPKQTKKYQRNINEAKRERLRAAPNIVSPSKRKSSQPMKIVSISNQEIYSDPVVNVLSNQNVKSKAGEVEIKAQSVTVERLISEAAGDNAIADASDVSTTQNPRCSTEDEESVEAIRKHLSKTSNPIESVVSQKKESIAAHMSKAGLVDMLSEKQKKFDANRPKGKTEVIAPLPMPRATRSRTRKTTQKIRPVSTIIAKSTNVVTEATAKPTVSMTEQKRSGDKETLVPSQKTKDIPKKMQQTKAEPSKVGTSKALTSVERNKESVDRLNEPNLSLVTPAKKRLQTLIFGECSDIDTPIKSPPKNTIKIKPAKQAEVKNDNPPSKPLRRSTRNSPVLEVENKNNKYEADSSTAHNVSDDSDDSNESDSDNDEDTYEMTLSIDETDKRHFISMRENASIVRKSTPNVVNLKSLKLNVDGVNVCLGPSDVHELYTQDVDSVAAMKNQNQRFGRSAKESIGKPTINEPNTEAIYGMPLHTSTPSPKKSITPKINILHKSSSSV